MEIDQRWTHGVRVTPEDARLYLHRHYKDVEWSDKDVLELAAELDLLRGYQPQTSANGHEQWVKVVSRGNSTFKAGDLVTRKEFLHENELVKRKGGQPASCCPWASPEPAYAAQSAQRLPSEYRDLLGFIDEPLPQFLAATVPEEGERKIDVVMRQLRAGVEGIQDSDQFRLFLHTMGKFHNYSIGNLILIALQRPGATHVAGFSTWKDLGRFVRKGEKGIMILAPVLPPREKVEPGEEPLKPEEIDPTPVYFKVVHVFDLSQTEGKELPQFDVPVLTGEANEELFAKALALAQAQGVTVTFEPRSGLDPDIKGMYSGKSIWVRPEESRAQQLKSLVHELAHYFTESVFGIPRRDAETIAESAAYVVGAHWGFDSGTRSFPYVAVWSQDKKVLQANLNAIRRVAGKILESLESGKEQHGPMLPTTGFIRGIYGAWVWEVPPSTSEAVVLALVAMDQFPPPKEEGWKLVHVQPGRFQTVQQAKEWIPDKPGKYVVAIGVGEGMMEWELVPRLGGETFLPALKPFEPYHFAEYVLRYNRFSEAEIPIYSGLTGRAPLRVPDHIWQEVIAELDGEFVKQGEIYVFHAPEKERPPYMRAAPTWRDVASTTKEPWQMTMGEYLSHWSATHPHGNIPLDFQQISSVQRLEIEQALSEGKPVPPEVLKDYPDLLRPTALATKKGQPFVKVGDAAGICAPAREGSVPATYGSTEAYLRTSIREEDQAQKDYLKRAITAVSQGDPKTSELFQHVAGEEAQHSEEFRGRLDELTRGETEFVSCSPEYLAYTIEDIGYRDKFDQAFQAAIARAKAR